MLLPAGSTLEEPIATNSHANIARIFVLTPLSGKNDKLDKVVWEQWTMAGAAKQHKAQILHSPYLAAPLRTRLPTVVTAHDMIPWVVPGYRGSLATRLYLALSVQGVKRAEVIIADSEASRRDVIRVLKVPSDKVHTVYLGVESHPEYGAEELREVRARFGLPEYYAFYMGGFDRRKNVPLLLRAWRAAMSRLDGKWYAEQKPVLAIAGSVPQPGGVVPDVGGEARSLGLDGMNAPVKFLGRISEGDKPLLMAAAHLFVYPSSYEGFGLDPLEAMSVGCPVVSSSGGSLTEVVGRGGILVSPDDEEALSQAIIRTWTDDALRADLRVRGKIQAMRFTWERTAEQTRKLYALALNKA
jgi:glycosyltransferase involved in cell wall biosynthesis